MSKAYQNSKSDKRLDALESQNLDSRLATAEANIGDNDADISNLQSLDLQNATLEKLKRDAVFYADFTKDEAITASDLSKTAQGVATAITYTAPDGQTGITADGRVATAGVDEPAIVYRDGECQGLQVVPSSTNLWLQSENLDTANYSNSGEISFSNSSEQSPIVGGSTPQSVNSSATLSTGFIYQTSSVTAGNVYSITTILKPTGISLSDITTAFYDNTNGALIVEDAEQTITPLRDGFYMISASATAPTGCVSMRGYIHRGSMIVGESFVHAGSQFEQGYPTPYIPTTTSQVARGAIRALLPTENIPLEQGFLFFDGVINESTVGATDLLSFGSGNISTDGIFIRSTGGGSVDFVSSSGGAILINSPQTQITLGQRHKILCVYSGTSLRGFIDGVKVFENTTDFVPPTQVTNSRLLGNIFASSISHNGTCRMAALCTGSLTDAKAIALTTLEE